MGHQGPVSIFKTHSSVQKSFIQCPLQVLFLLGGGLFRTPSTSWEHNQKMLKQSGDDCTQLSSTVSEDPGPQPAGPEAFVRVRSPSDGGHQLLINSKRLIVAQGLAAEAIRSFVWI